MLSPHSRGSTSGARLGTVELVMEMQISAAWLDLTQLKVPVEKSPTDFFVEPVQLFCSKHQGIRQSVVTCLLPPNCLSKAMGRQGWVYTLEQSVPNTH